MTSIKVQHIHLIKSYCFATCFAPSQKHSQGCTAHSHVSNRHFKLSWGWPQVADSQKHGDEPVGSIKCRDFLRSWGPIISQEGLCSMKSVGISFKLTNCFVVLLKYHVTFIKPFPVVIKLKQVTQTLWLVQYYLLLHTNTPNCWRCTFALACLLSIVSPVNHRLHRKVVYICERCQPCAAILLHPSHLGLKWTDVIKVVCFCDALTGYNDSKHSCR